MPQASPMSSTCRDVMFDQDWGIGPTREVEPAANFLCLEQKSAFYHLL